MTHSDPAQILLRASAAIRRRDVLWGRDFFRNPCTGQRCALGAIGWAGGDTVEGGNPFFDDRTAEAAKAFAQWLVDERGETACYSAYQQLDPLETVAGWNDDKARTAADVWRALSECAAYLDEKACRQRHPAGKALTR